MYMLVYVVLTLMSTSQMFSFDSDGQSACGFTVLSTIYQLSSQKNGENKRQCDFGSCTV